MEKTGSLRIEFIEEWKPIKNYPGYEVSNLGRFRSYWKRIAIIDQIKPPKIITPSLQIDGYRILRIKGGKPVAAHRIVLQAFAGECPEKYEGAHLNGKRDDNRIQNLKWVTRKENHSHKQAHGTLLAGFRHPKCKIDRKDAKFILKKLHEGFCKYKIHRAYKFPRGAIDAVSKGKWI